MKNHNENLAPDRISGWRSFINRDAPHQDLHGQPTVHLPKAVPAFGSIYKMIHGSIRHFEINALGSLLAATWKFERPDSIFIGEDRDR